MGSLKSVATCRSQTQREGCNIKQQEILHLRGARSCQDRSLHNCPISYCFLWINADAQLLTIKKRADHALDLGDTRGPSDEDNIVHIGLVDAAIPQACLHKNKRSLEVVLIHILELRPRQGAGIVDAAKEIINLDCRPDAVGESALCALTLHLQPAKRTLLSKQALPPCSGRACLAIWHSLTTMLQREVSHAELQNAGVEITAAQVRVASDRPHLKDAILNRE
mmetsp:Transcript_108716/g.232317  ORF Transcript_108716/g.232317 Transcript_108716/m.232317 type:complete len:223 (-) Transcript_108716:2469-3137(-)